MGTRIGRLSERRARPRLASHGARSKPSLGSRIALTLCVVTLTAPCLDSGSAHAEDVRGSVSFKPGKDDSVKKLGTRPVRSEGFVERRENPWLPVQELDPRPQLVVVLEGGEVADEDKKPPGAIQSYPLVGESFEVPLLAVVVGTRVKVVNRTAHPRVLVTPDDPSLIDSVSINPRGEHEFKVTNPHQPVIITAEDTAHLRGAVVGFPHRFFSLVDGNGRFELKNVPEGQWKLRVWYRDGWLEGLEQTVDVGKKRVDVDVDIAPKLIRDTGR